MNKTKNQSEEEIIACGQKGSHIRNKEEYNITISKLIEIWNDSINRKFEDFYTILKEDKVPEDEWHGLVKTALFYSNTKK